MPRPTGERCPPTSPAQARPATLSPGGGVAGLGGGRLNELAVAAEAVITDILLSAREGVLEIQSVHDEEVVRISIEHPEIEQRRMKNLERLLERYLDDYEITPTRAMLEKRLR
jgi:hypothetical protein